ncbi:tyrosine-type recombinase/integrase [Isoptericola sp. b490]|uniref:tyrosine-type recombinase/integrase n=1 Tax=Actinotalea lenta TaxID=3064654 RepID=UPI002713632F|nr:tyrosine-type recombinase/integrase [Isoptericola sp. b490]MDO8121860.1 tyrosine-type recombinase/integrase [Isoptericola sp. b490]
MPARRGDKWEGRLKIGGQVVATRRFETKRAASDWERRQRGAFDEHGYDPSRGKATVEALLVVWLEQRTGRVSTTTLNTDRYLLPTPGQRSGRTGTETILPTWFRKLHVGKVTPAAISAWQDGLLARGLAPTSVKRHRESLSSFFAWCVSEGYVAANPVKAATPPKDRRVREDMRPLPAHELEAVVRDVAEASEVYAGLVLVLARTGIRWGEARAILVRDFVEVPIPALHVVRNQPEGVAAATTPKSGRGRRVPLPDALVPVLQGFAAGKGPDDLLLTRPGGGQLHRSTFIRQTGWDQVGRGRTLHDLRHTAACEWILRGVPLTTVQAWLGHGSIEVTARYLHHLGDSADRAALQLLNDSTAPSPRGTGAGRGDSGVILGGA